MNGFAIIESPWMSESKQVRFPRSKKKRIRRKWAKQQKNYASFPMPVAYQFGDALVMHPALAAKLKKEVERLNDDQLTHAPLCGTGSCSADVNFDSMRALINSFRYESPLLNTKFPSMLARYS